jgi:hypothetical protein
LVESNLQVLRADQFSWRKLADELVPRRRHRPAD